MALSLYWPGRYHFHPVGNTSATCLTRDVAPETSPNILLLACGDLRNVLYTVFCEAPSMGRTLDFTCCDLDPAVLARNILLLTLIIDGVPAEIAWNIFYHMYLDSESRSALATHSQKLASYSTLEAWRSSPYGVTIKMATDHTLAQLRRYWDLYADFYEPAKAQRFQFLQKSMERKRNAVVREHGRAVHFSSARSSGLLMAQPQTIMLSSEQFEHYWKIGTTFTDAARLAKSTHPNATFFHLRAHEGFDVHFTTDPMVPFHHAPLFADTNCTPTIKDLVESAKSQFCGWYSAFRTAATARKAGEDPRVVIRFLLGDALAVSRALQVWPSNPDAQKERSCTAFASAQWTACTVDLDREEYDFGAPVRFDVIDTATLSDDVGMHNVFLCAAPLLANTPTAVLYTESLLARNVDPIADLQNKLFGDLSVIALLLHLAPVDALSGFTTRCNTHELTIAQMTIPVAMSLDKQQCHQTFTWKRPTSGDPSISSLGTVHPAVSFDADNFAHLLHKMYSRLFEHEDPGYVKTHSARANPVLVVAWASSWCPSRESFVMLLALIRARARVPDAQWSAMMRAFLDILYDDAVKQHPFDALGHNEIYAQLYRYGLHTVPGLDRPGRPTAGRLSHWPVIPPLVRIFLTVPRASFEKLKSVSKKLPNTWLHCCVTLPRIEHVYQSVDATYGSIVNTGTIDAPDISVVEDPDAPTVVFSFVVTGHLLTSVTPDDVVIRLAARTNPMAAKILMPVLGPDLTIFSARLQDANHVHLAPEQPLSPKPFSHILPTQGDGSHSTASTVIGTQSSVHVTLDATGKRIASLTARLEIENAEAKATLVGSANPDVSQVSPCAMQVALGQLTQTLAYPLPIVGSQCKLRIARKSSYIEVVVPVAIPFLQPDGYKLNPFPIVRANVNQATLSWNLHRVPLDRLPVLHISPANAATVGKWYDPHVGSQLSARESALKAAKQRDADVLANLKDTLRFLMVRGAGTQGAGRARVVALRDDIANDSDTLFFVDKVRLDVAAHTVVLDAFVLPLCPALMRTLGPLFEQLLQRGIVNVRRVYGREMRAWKRLLPALVERCRTAWTHGANCEYTATGRIPLGLETGEGDPLCGCGRGKDVDGMLRPGAGDERGLWAKFAPFVTRVAISPLFAVSYVERVVGQEEEEEGEDPAPAPPAARRRPGAKTSSARCNKCRKEESSAVKLLKCSRCKTASYCSEACQKSDWKTHKLKCQG